jgi:hypothetical protein
MGCQLFLESFQGGGCGAPLAHMQGLVQRVPRVSEGLEQSTWRTVGVTLPSRNALQQPIRAAAPPPEVRGTRGGSRRGLHF